MSIPSSREKHLLSMASTIMSNSRPFVSAGIKTSREGRGAKSHSFCKLAHPDNQGVFPCSLSFSISLDKQQPCRGPSQPEKPQNWRKEAVPPSANSHAEQYNVEQKKSNHCQASPYTHAPPGSAIFFGRCIVKNIKFFLRGNNSLAHGATDFRSTKLFSAFRAVHCSRFGNAFPSDRKSSEKQCKGHNSPTMLPFKNHNQERIQKNNGNTCQDGHHIAQKLPRRAILRHCRLR